MAGAKWGWWGRSAGLGLGGVRRCWLLWAGPLAGGAGLWGFAGGVRGVGAGLGSGEGPFLGLGVQAERGEARQVDGGGEQVEVGVDFGPAPHAGSSAAVPAAFEVGELALDFGRVAR